MERAEKRMALQRRAERFEEGKKGGVKLLPYRAPRVKGKAYPYASTKRLGGAASL
jgi:hypothetical protein